MDCHLARLRNMMLVLLGFVGSLDTNYALEVNTPKAYRYVLLTPPAGVNVSSLSKFCFSVKICNDAHVLLSSDASNSSNVYEIVIGGWSNSKSVIRTRLQGTNVKQAHHNPLSCSSFRQFYVSWAGGVVTVGSVTETSGESVEQQFLEYTDVSPSAVNYLFVSGWNKKGEWRTDFTCSTPTTTVSPETTSYTTVETTESLTEATTEIARSITTPQEVDLTTTVSRGVTTQYFSTDSVDNTASQAQTSDVSTASTTYAFETASSRETTTQNHLACVCHCALPLNTILPTIPEVEAEIASTLLIPANTTSKRRRRLTSAPDERPSSEAIGIVGVICLVVPVVLLVCLDLVTFSTGRRKWG